jgi:hypothetical protein
MKLASYAASNHSEPSPEARQAKLSLANTLLAGGLHSFFVHQCGTDGNRWVKLLLVAFL